MLIRLVKYLAFLCFVSPLVAEAMSYPILNKLIRDWYPVVGVGAIYQSTNTNSEINSSDVTKNFGLSGPGSEISLGFENSSTPLYLRGSIFYDQGIGSNDLEVRSTSSTSVLNLSTKRAYGIRLSPGVKLKHNILTLDIAESSREFKLYYGAPSKSGGNFTSYAKSLYQIGFSNSVYIPNSLFSLRLSYAISSYDKLASHLSGDKDNYHPVTNQVGLALVYHMNKKGEESSFSFSQPCLTYKPEFNLHPYFGLGLLNNSFHATRKEYNVLFNTQQQDTRAASNADAELIAGISEFWRGYFLSEEVSFSRPNTTIQFKDSSFPRTNYRTIDTYNIFPKVKVGFLLDGANVLYVSAGINYAQIEQSPADASVLTLGQPYKKTLPLLTVGLGLLTAVINNHMQLSISETDSFSGRGIRDENPSFGGNSYSRHVNLLQTHLSLIYSV